MNINHDDNLSSQYRPPNTIADSSSYENTRSPTRDDSHYNLAYLRNTSHETNDQLSSTSPLRPLYDENVFPLGGQQSKLNDNQSTSSHDSRIFEVQGQVPVSRDSYTDSIPLRNNPAFVPKDESITDHVYDAPAQQPNFPGNQESKIGGVLRNFSSSESTGKLPWMTYALTIIQCVVFIIEIIKNGERNLKFEALTKLSSAQLTGSPIEFQPSFNPMIGPSPYILINMGARYTPCMHAVDGLQTRITGGEINWPCPNATSNNVADCQLNNLCGFNMPASKNPQYPGQNIPLNEFSNQPNQWFRFILPIFLHAGLIHIGFNMLLQVTLGKEIEITIGSIRFFLVYISSGIFGFVLGGNFAASGIASTGASGALFGILALNLLDLFYTWGERRSPVKDFAYLMLDIVISFVLGLLPGLDNFSHIGGFLMGLALGICILHSPNAFRKKINQNTLPYTPVSQIKMTNDFRSGVGFLRSPVDFFRGRRIAWWAWWLVRVGSLVFVFIVFILLLKNFYSYRKTCSWCKYLSCIDINNWCDIGNLQLTTISGPTKRSIHIT